MATSSSVPTTSTACPTEVTTKEPIRLVLCFDGTSNTYHGTDEDTNVVKLLRKLNRHHPNQYHYYQTGIGTYDEDDASVNKSKIAEAKAAAHGLWDQGFGTTFDSHVMSGYKFLMKYYEEGAKIYIFGFSRGAYTAKFLAQMINTLGLLCRGGDFMIDLESVYGVPSPKNAKEDAGKDANDLAKGKRKPDIKYWIDQQTSKPHEPYDYNESETPQKQKADKKSASGLEAALAEVQDFGGTFCRRDPTISKLMFGGNIKVHFLGIWDCVNSVAVLESTAEKPMPVFGTAKYIRHAVAIDERRVKFRPSLLSQDIRARRDVKALKRVQGILNSANISDEDREAISQEVLNAKKEDIKEVWFPGGHGDVGGGWPIDDSAPKKQGWGQWAASYLPGHKALCSTHKVEDGDSATTGPRIQMSDIPLAWMIDEILAVDKAEREKEGAGGKKVTPGLAWNYHRLQKFKDNFHSWKFGVVKSELNGSADLGALHDSLSLRWKGLGTALMWNALGGSPKSLS